MTDAALARRAQLVSACAVLLMIAWVCVLATNLLGLRLYSAAEDVVGLAVCLLCYRFSRGLAVLLGWFRGSR